MKVLVLHRRFRLQDRPTIDDHLYSFQRYSGDDEFAYLNLWGPAALTEEILAYPYDAVIFHYTFLAARFDQDFEQQYEKLRPLLQRLKGYKVFFVHDEYVFTRWLWKMIRDLDVGHVYATIYPEDYETVFPAAETGKTNLCSTVLPGYVEETRQMWINSRTSRSRKIDVGYRALRSDYAFGQHGYLKTQVALEMQEAVRDTGLHTDIRMTEEGYVNTIVGDKWFDYLLNCRTTIGCLGGSSLMDPDGSLRRAATQYSKQHPKATYEEVEQACYPGMDGQIHSHLFGPKIFECAMTCTCQVLVKDDYRGVLEPGRDFIELEPDYSNIGHVLEMIRDISACETIAKRCYETLVASGRYTYRKFAGEIMAEIRSAAPLQNADQTGWREVLRAADEANRKFERVLRRRHLKQSLAQGLYQISPRLYHTVRQKRHGGGAER